MAWKQPTFRTPSFHALSLLLEYPREDLIEGLDFDEIDRILREEEKNNGGAAETLAPLIEYLCTKPLDELEESYTETFEWRHSLLLYEYVYGEGNVRGQAVADLRGKYATAGFYPDTHIPPDYAPFILVYYALLPQEEAMKSLGRTARIFKTLRENLEKSGSPYALVFRALESMSHLRAPNDASAQPRSPPHVPSHPMGEAIERDGTDQYGIEPVISQSCSSSCQLATACTLPQQGGGCQ